MAVSDTLIGTLFDGRYQVVRKLGAGGMANVYLAEDQELGRRVAIKILNDRHADDEQFVERFRREAKNAAALSHPNIVSIYDRGEAEGTYYIAMEYLDGRSLKELIVSRGPAPITVAVEYARQILSALRFAHRHGIVHRDIKPHNVLVDARGPREGDGLRHRARRCVADDRSRLDRRHRAVPLARAGARNRRRPALRSLLARDRAVRAAHRHAAVQRRHAGRDRDEASVADPEPPSATRPEIPRDLDLVVTRALAKDPDDRYQSAEEMDADLERFARGAAVSPETEESATQIMRAPTGPLAATAATMVAPPRASSSSRRRRRRSTTTWRSRCTGGRSGRGSPPSSSCSVRRSAAGSSTSRSPTSSTRRSRSRSSLYENQQEQLARANIKGTASCRSSTITHPNDRERARLHPATRSPAARIGKGSNVTIWVSTGLPKADRSGSRGQAVDRRRRRAHATASEARRARRQLDEARRARCTAQDPPAGHEAAGRTRRCGSTSRRARSRSRSPNVARSADRSGDLDAAGAGLPGEPALRRQRPAREHGHQPESGAGCVRAARAPSSRSPSRRGRRPRPCPT